MHPRIGLFVGSLFFALTTASVPPMVNNALAVCSPNDRINGTTGADATRVKEHAGYTQVQVYEVVTTPGTPMPC
jgi:hypothetical protein